MTGTSSAFHITQVEEIKRIVGEAMYEKQIIGPDGSPVSGDQSVATWADLMAIASPTAGMRRTVAGAVLAGGALYTRWIYNGTMWRPDGPQDLLLDDVPSVGIAGTALQVLKTFACPANLLRSVRMLGVYVSFAKSGTTDAATSVGLRIGTTGTSSDGLLAASSALSAPNRQFFFDSVYEFPTATQARYIGAGTNGFGSGNATSQAYPVVITTPNQSDQVYISAFAQMAGSTDTPSASRMIVYAR